MNFDFEKGEVLLIDKPLQWTSFDVVNKLRYKISKKIGVKRIKIGHAGTLDPLATGLLIICTGKMTKQIDTFQAQEKEYTGSFVLGSVTPSYDLETEVEFFGEYKHLTHEEIINKTKDFLGEIDQKPPIFSAIKVNGKALYHSARKGEEVIVPTKKITIHQFDITHIELPKIDFKINCSKGTYIRSLANDFGQSLKSGAHLSALTRTKIGEYSLENAYQLDSFLEIIDNL
ncbi:MAG: tRNA pseudouridine(55) synthase TruB [Bacteroidetes bacterium]|nr:MAG: tRNA pseudouridine(55) synthase TruB [Bacteroidota bacterium]TAG86050.1 MAG: tRNA pseudouridine(55) synthase TruB [Bacteroidota bacterium]